MIFQRNVTRRSRATAVRNGWNDAAWGQPHREVEPVAASWYESGYAGGQVYRQRQEVELSQRAVLSNVQPRIVPAA